MLFTVVRPIKKYPACRFLWKGWPSDPELSCGAELRGGKWVTLERSSCPREQLYFSSGGAWLWVFQHTTPGSLWGEARRPMIKCQDCYSALPKAPQVKGYDHCMSSYELCKYTQCVFHFLFKRRTLCFS